MNRPRKRKGRGKGGGGGSGVRLWGRHAIEAALANPARSIRTIWGTREALEEFDLPPEISLRFAGAQDLGKLVPHDAPHQGLVAEVDPLESAWLADAVAEAADANAPIVVLDQVTDPHNVGAIFRSAAAFGACAIVTQDRHSPPESGALAKAASGALEKVPWVRAVNLARALDEIAELGFWRIGLAGEAETTLADALGDTRPALVLGAEGAGLRHNIAAHCDALARLPIADAMESLNVSNAAAISLYAAQERKSR